MDQQNRSFFEKININWVTPILAIITGIYGVMFKINSDKINNLKTRMETELRQKEFENDLKLTIYKEVKDAITSKDTVLQNATLMVVNEMLRDDTDFREKLKTVLFAASGSKGLITVQKQIDQFSAEQQQTPSATTARPTIEVFFLDDLPKEAEPRAQQVITVLKAKYPSYDIRLRKLPKEVNAQRGYRVDANQIRYGKDNAALAKELRQLLVEEHIFTMEQPRLTGRSNQPENYISIFVRNM